ncbi:unnamed protein product, partial [marine sediment metagenome]
MSKKFFAILASFVIIGLAFPASPVWAQDGAGEEDVSIGEVSDPGILPDSPFYFVKSWGRAIRLSFAFNSQKKAELALRFANEDALAIKKLCDKGECQLAEKHCEKFQEQFQRAIQRMERVREEGKDIEALIEKLKENHLRQQQVLASVLEKASQLAGVGPMAAVAGAIAEAVGKDLLPFSPEIIVENGGDIFLKILKKRLVGIYAGQSPFT